MAEGVFPLNNIGFPQGPFFDQSTQDISLEWWMWLQNLRNLIFAFVDTDSILSAFDGFSPAQQAAISEKLESLAVEVASIADQTSSIASLASVIANLRVVVASIVEFNPGPLTKRVENLEVMGAFR